MATYPNSRISTYENCPLQYKLHYIDKLEVETPTTIEAFMGDLVHQTLEKLYKNKKFQKDIPKKDLLEFYKNLWEKEEFLELMKEKRIYDLRSMICYPKIQSKFLKGELDSDVADKITKEKDWRISLKKKEM